MNLNFLFISSDHLRYEQGIHVSGHHGGAKRAIEVKPNPKGIGYLVTIYNFDNSYFGSNVQIFPKLMKNE